MTTAFPPDRRSATYDHGGDGIETEPSPAPVGPTTSAPVEVETFGLRLVDGSLTARAVRSALVGDPDVVAAAQIGLDPTVATDTVLHSTSWRWSDGCVVLTYLCCPDPIIGGGVDDETVTASPDHPATVDPTRPGGWEPTSGHVLHHGIDHLAWLADHHASLVERSRRSHPALWNAVMRAGRHRAGQFPHAHAI